MKSKTKKILEMLKQLFDGKYGALEFSNDFADYCYHYYDAIEEEYEGLGYYLDQVVPDICDEAEPGFNPTHMIEELKKVYDKVLEIIESN